MKIGYRRIGKYKGTEAIQNSINVTEQGIALSVKKDELMSEINARADEIDIYSNNVVIESDGYSLKNGILSIKNNDLDISGDLTTKVDYTDIIENYWDSTNKRIISGSSEFYGPTFGIYNVTDKERLTEYVFYVKKLYAEQFNTREMGASFIHAYKVETSNLFFNDSEGRNLTIYGTFNNTSLEQYKKNFEKLDNALNIIEDIDIYKYNLLDEEDTSKKHIGMVIGDDYNYSKEITSANNDSVDMYSMISVCLQAIKEQQKQIEELKEVIKGLQK